jgi:FMN phosphatase YigB (HAD superfamily)
VFLDDRIENIIGAKNLGMQTVLVGSTAHHPSADYSIMHVTDLRVVMPHLFTTEPDLGSTPRAA